jgi:hypothetical protein
MDENVLKNYKIDFKLKLSKNRILSGAGVATNGLMKKPALLQNNAVL